MTHMRILDPDESGDWEIWLNPEEDDEYVGLCIGVGETRAAAIEDAIGDIGLVLKQLEEFRKNV